MSDSAARPEPNPSLNPDDPVELDALIIGAGFSGLYQLHTLRDRLGLRVRVLEAGGGIGGTWYWNRYPGARCDSESHSYAYVFSKELHEGWSWSERYPGQAEIVRYLEYVADRLALMPDIQLGTRVVSARFLERETRWEVVAEGGQRFRATYLITAVGCLSSANVPDLPGLKSFEGRWYHTGRWPHGGVDFAGQCVGQIGTGSTGIQTAPVIAQTARHLTVFQRTANYSVPARNTPLTEAFKQEVREGFDEIRALLRSTQGGHPFSLSPTKAFEVDDAERTRRYEQAWETGGLRFRTTFMDLVTDKTANDTAASFLKAKIRETVNDPETAEALADIDHPFGAKRPPIDTNYFETFNRPNVTLVNLRKTPLVCVTPRGIETAAGEHPLDIIVFATGFDAMTGALLSIDIQGRDGLSLREAWREGPRTYLGLGVAGFPNLFTVTGPGSPSVLTNMAIALQQHVEWITDCIAHLEETGQRRIEAQPEAVADWAVEVQRAADTTLLPTVPHSWYLGANVPGKPRVFMPYAGGMVRYRQICDEVAAAGYRGFQIGPAGEKAPQGVSAA